MEDKVKSEKTQAEIDRQNKMENEIIEMLVYLIKKKPAEHQKDGTNQESQFTLDEECRGEMDDPASSSKMYQKHDQSNQKYDFFKWEEADPRDITNSSCDIKSIPSLKVSDLETTYDELLARVNNQMSLLQKKLKDQKEQERLRKIQEEMEKEKLRKAEEERLKKEMEENQRKKAEIERRRKFEEKIKQFEELSQRNLEILKTEQQKGEARLREQLEQERRDHELALRLANECNSQVEDFTSSNKMNQNHGQPNKKYDFSKLKYSDLRDSINTSCDIDFLEACRHEFYRRLKVYHAWKARNNKKTDLEQNERAPKAIMDAVSANRASIVKNVSTIPNGNHSQRYFRIPFVKSNLAKNSTDGQENGVSHNQTNGKKGWWYAHFDGQYVARQMELHPDKPAILLVASVDDMQMCELSLDETGLSRKKGAEILEQEFEKEWNKHGGKPYIRSFK